MSRLSAFARTPRGIVATVVVALLVIAGGVGAGVTLADHSDSTVPAATKTSPTPAAASSGQEAKGVHGKIVAASPDRLTLREGDGTVLTVLITAKTRFGSKKRPATAADLVPGTRVTVIGSLSGTTVSARRIVPAKAKASTPGPSPSSSSTV